MEVLASARLAVSAKTRDLTNVERDALIKNGCVAACRVSPAHLVSRNSRQILLCEYEAPCSLLLPLAANLTACSASTSCLRTASDTAEDWTNVKVVQSNASESQFDFNPATVQRCQFSGRVVLGFFRGLKGNEPTKASAKGLMPELFGERRGDSIGNAAAAPWRGSELEGVYDSHLADVWVLQSARVIRCGLVQNCVVGPGATVSHCGVVGSPDSCPSSFGNGQFVTVGPETGGRDVPICATSNFEDLAQYCCRRTLPQSLAASAEATAAEAVVYGRKCSAPFTVIAPLATLRGCARVEKCLVGPHVTIECSVVKDSTILGSKALPTRVLSSAIEGSIVQTGCQVVQHSVVTKSMMCIGSGVLRHGLLISSILSTHSTVSEGEVGSSLLGPLVGFHHQALLVAAFWPAGRGNIGYGANVGSNHTGKRNDQEIWPGEGVFYGLGCCIKYPCNMSEAPYTIIASGVSTLPQRVTMPFSLINSVSEFIPGVSPALNEILPGWVLSNNAYTTVRNEKKFEKRLLAKVDGTIPQYSHRTIRGEHVQMMIAACAQLHRLEGASKVSDRSGQPVYTDEDIPGGAGLGKNILTESSRVAAIQAYDSCVELYALKTIWAAVGSLIDRAEAEIRLDHRSGTLVRKAELDCGVVSLSGLRTHATAKAELTYAFELVHERQLAGYRSGYVDLMKRLLELVVAEANQIKTSKNKDYKRGNKIIPDYSQIQDPLEEDATVRAAEEFALKVQASLEECQLCAHHHSHI